ncbi:MAG TPA: HAD hydrolase family protein, partial [Candidatus Thalassarchaeaceae archaeon]|nr:HAD hydrolase family protein [Candidatus Thalassarchaeaceae archaeon]
MQWPNREDFDMIIFDIDGTLLDENGFNPDLIPLIRKVEELGIIVSLASGRTLPNVTPIQQSLAVSGFVVGENGGMIWDTRLGFPIRALADGKRAREAAD